MNRLLALGALLALSGCQAGGNIRTLDLSFGSYESSPAVLTHLSFEQPLARTPEMIVASSADVPGTLGGRTNSASVLSPPTDTDGDGAWTIRAQWVELTTDKAWTATAVVPLDRIRIDENVAVIGIVFGPNGEMLIASDEPTPDPSGYRDAARVCGSRAPDGDRAWRLDTDRFPEMTDFLDPPPPSVRDPFCPAGETGR
ncbi:hypothetical protein [Jannaschia aquimarina]|uniref:Lipoprotein n=1 Tax=Jannaschia aquimarina TaxID=935700 RepID=A0A0D1DAD6_9RHOB|nr:hypothetical protein [Jannaschia aquimarina]KIT16873.1 hypothetical protein jaqu_13710 [Jannaschia aquimarina]SNT12594.1 hypothetical protein SAMN05421775_10677 [Jannaschia aquimarina]